MWVLLLGCTPGLLVVFAGVAFFDECCAAFTALLVDGVLRETLLLFVVELFVTELLVVELFVVLLLVTLVFVVELTPAVDFVEVGVAGADAHDAGLKLFTACQSRMCRLFGQGLTMCGWLLPGP